MEAGECPSQLCTTTRDGAKTHSRSRAVGAQRVTSSPPCYPQEANCDPSSQPTPRPHLVTCVRVLKSRERMDRSTSIQPMYWGERVVSQRVSQPRGWIPVENLIFSPALQSSPPSLTLGLMSWIHPPPPTNL